MEGGQYSLSDLIALTRGEMERQKEVWNRPRGGERGLGSGLVTGWGQGPAARYRELL